ncbi:hypothetical protein BRADI_2g19890v3 [Brachypodium distachyon]|uniref:Peptidase A1 domain-containing protein n=1 Tax=Brachypodium distachyon TaxID=15368 RepID=I1HHN0_BRADI|nr:hypothetical protein BRADI_2g19890v3 [Brachypodium distachyon]
MGAAVPGIPSAGLALLLLVCAAASGAEMGSAVAGPAPAGLAAALLLLLLCAAASSAEGRRRDASPLRRGAPDVITAEAWGLPRGLQLAGQQDVQQGYILKCDNLSLIQDVQQGYSRVQRLYYACVKLGNPPKDFSLQFDTGSDLLWTSCSLCQNCQATPFLNVPLEVYNPKSSSTASKISCSDERCTQVAETGKATCDPTKNQCGYTQSYADGSITSGNYFSDTMHLDTIGNKSTANTLASVFFGRSNSRTGQFAADGVIGFGKNVLSVVSQLSAQGVSPKVFSHCLKGSDDGVVAAFLFSLKLSNRDLCLLRLFHRYKECSFICELHYPGWDPLHFYFHQPTKSEVPPEQIHREFMKKNQHQYNQNNIKLAQCYTIHTVRNFSNVAKCNQIKLQFHNPNLFQIK